MITVQNACFASCGCADSLVADLDTIERYVGCSALSAIDAIDLAFTGKQLWKCNRIGNDYTTNTTVKVSISSIECGL